MPTKWNLGRWNSFRWGQSAEFETLLAQKTGVHVRPRIIWALDAGNQDITQYFLGGGDVSQEKERPPDRLTAGDALLRFSNASGVFTEDSASSFLFGVNYHNRNISIEIGLNLADGTFEYRKVATMKVSSVEFHSDTGEVAIRVYDQVSRILKEKISRRPAAMVATAGGSNVGNGTVSDIDTRPFVTVAENWTLTCTLAGGDSTATFSVVGSVSGNVGTATSGTEFSNATTGGVKLTIKAGGTNWALNDAFTFSTVQMMEWAAINPIKILWSILTGYAYNTDVAEGWLARTPQLDHTQSSTNTDLDWPAFQKAVSDADDALFTLKGFIPWDYDLIDALEEILLHFLGAIYVDAAGRITVKIFRPELAIDPPNFADSKKIVSLSYVRDVRDVINHVSVKYRKLDTWPWSDEDEKDTLDGLYVAFNQTSHDALDGWFSEEFTSRWYNANADHVVYLATRVIDKYSRPPRRFSIETGVDALEAEIGDVVTITDTKFGLTAYEVEIMKKNGAYSDKPVKVTLEAEDTGTLGISWAFLGSSVDEGDGISPQAATFASASATDKFFCYLSQTGGADSTGKDYYMFAALAALFIGGGVIVL